MASTGTASPLLYLETFWRTVMINHVNLVSSMFRETFYGIAKYNVVLASYHHGTNSRQVSDATESLVYYCTFSYVWSHFRGMTSLAGRRVGSCDSCGDVGKSCVISSENIFLRGQSSWAESSTVTNSGRRCNLLALVQCLGGAILISEGTWISGLSFWSYLWKGVKGFDYNGKHGFVPYKIFLASFFMLNFIMQLQSCYHA
jgi:hypothetical protein